MKYLSHLFESNRAWTARQTAQDASFFSRLASIQRPDYLWIGCADSRVPANEIVGLAPGELFVHRNVANVVKLDDVNCMAVVQYAIESLGVRHVIVCGHYGCGGVRSAMDGGISGNVEKWLAPVRTLAREQSKALVELTDVQRWSRLCELNVIEQVRNVIASDVIQKAWSSGVEIDVHGWIYDVADGLLRDLGITASLPDRGDGV